MCNAVLYSAAMRDTEGFTLHYTDIIVYTYLHETAVTALHVLGSRRLGFES